MILCYNRKLPRDFIQVQGNWGRGPLRRKIIHIKKKFTLKKKLRRKMIPQEYLYKYKGMGGGACNLKTTQQIKKVHSTDPP